MPHPFPVSQLASVLQADFDSLHSAAMHPTNSDVPQALGQAYGAEIPSVPTISVPQRSDDFWKTHPQPTSPESITVTQVESSEQICFTDGIADGNSFKDGAEDGTIIGVADGSEDGETDGSENGMELGASEGATEGETVGNVGAEEELGATDGVMLGIIVGSGVVGEDVGGGGGTFTNISSPTNKSEAGKFILLGRISSNSE